MHKYTYEYSVGVFVSIKGVPERERAFSPRFFLKKKKKQQYDFWKGHTTGPVSRPLTNHPDGEGERGGDRAPIVF